MRVGSSSTGALRIRLASRTARFSEPLYYAADPRAPLKSEEPLISATSTKTGLAIRAAYDPEWYPKGVKITDAELADVPLTPHDFHGEWNYTINAQPNPP